MPSQACIDCHFFIKSYRDSQPPHNFVATEEDRAAVRRNDFSWHADTRAALALSCSMDVWDEGVSGFPHDAKYDLLVQQERKGFCFFRKHEPGMLLSAAKELQKREMAAAESSRDRKLTFIGLWIAALALLASVVLQLVQLMK